MNLDHIIFAAPFNPVLKFNHAVSTVGVEPVPSVPVVNLAISSKVVENFVLGAHQLGVCHVAAVEEVAVNTCPELGAVAALTSTVVVADLRAFVIPEVNPVAVPVALVATRALGVPRAGVTRVMFVHVPVGV